VVAERAERDPRTRWCTRPGCGSICLPWVAENSFSWHLVTASLMASAAAAAVPLHSPAFCAALRLTPWVAASTSALGVLGFITALWYGRCRLGPRRRSVCPTCNASVCYDCKNAWHPNTMCDEVLATSLVRWCKLRDAGQCPRCGVFIERRAGCNHMDCRCGHSFCWLCLLPLSERCDCPQFGGRRTPEAKARLSSADWRRSILFGADAVALQRLFFTLLVGVSLQNAELIWHVAMACVDAAHSSSLLVQLLTAQLCLGFLHLRMARRAMGVFPRRVYKHFALRQLDLSFGGFGSHFLLMLLHRLDRCRMLPPIPALTRHRLPGRLLASTISLLMMGRPMAEIPAEEHASERVRVVPAIHDYPQRHDYRPFAISSNVAGYMITRRCLAALPTVTSLAFAWECFLPALAPLFLVALMAILSTVLLAHLAIGASALHWLIEACEASGDGILWLLHVSAIPQAALYLYVAAATLGCFALLIGTAFMGNILSIISLLSVTRECGLRRHVSARLAVDPDVRVSELRLDGDLTYSIECLRIDSVRMLLDVRAALFHIQTYLLLNDFSAELWRSLHANLGGSDVFTTYWSINPLAWIYDTRLLSGVVCATAVMAHLEPLISSWCTNWTGRYLLPTNELLTHGFEAVRLYVHLLIVFPIAVSGFVRSILPGWLRGWLSSEAARELVPSAEELTHYGHILALLANVMMILYALSCFHPKRKVTFAVAAATACAFGIPLASTIRAELAAVAGEATVETAVEATAEATEEAAGAPSVALSSVASPVTTHAVLGAAHRALMMAALPAFAALTLTILPCAWPAADAPPPKTSAGWAVRAIAGWARAIALPAARADLLHGGEHGLTLAESQMIVNTVDTASAGGSVAGENSDDSSEEEEMEADFDDSD